jgi:hypothetical protein
MPHLSDLDRISGELLRSRATDQRYDHTRAGDLLHVVVKKLGRIPDGGGWRLDGANATNHHLTNTGASRWASTTSTSPSTT